MSGTERILIKKKHGPDAGGQVPLYIVSRPSPVTNINVLDSLYDAVVLTNRSGVVQQANLRAAELLGYPLTDLRGMALGQIVDGINEELLGLMGEKLQSGRFIVLEARCTRQNGSLFPAEVAVGAIELGEGSGLCFSLRNITRWREIQNQLHMAQNALQCAPCALAMADLDSKLTFVNAAFCRMWGLEKPEFALCWSLDQMFGADNAGQLRLCLETQAPWSGELAIARADGTTLRIQATSAPNLDHAGVLAGLVFSFTELSPPAGA
jgi:PAS domain S-box-containing protein